MCSAIPRRIAVIGSSGSPGLQRRRLRRGARQAAPRRGAARRWRGLWRCGRGRRRGWLRAGAALRRAPDSMNARMSFFVTRPPRPVPCDLRRVDAVLGRDARDDGRDERLAVRRRRCRPARAPGLRGSGCGGAGAGVSAAERGARLGAACSSRGAGGWLAAPPARAPRPRRADHRQLRPDLDRLALLDEDLAARRPLPGSAPRCRPCRSRSRAAARRPRRARPPA